MRSPRITAAQLRALVAPRLGRTARSHSPRLLLVQGDPTAVPDVTDIGGHAVSVHGTSSPLEVRRLLQEAGSTPAAPPLVILTSADTISLGDDLVTRADPPKLLRPDRWGLVCRLFGAQCPAADLAKRAPLADALIEAQPVDGYPQVAGRVLTLETAAAALVRAYLGISDDVASAAAFLQWAAHPEGTGRLVSSEALLDDLRPALCDRFGPAVDGIIPAVLSGHHDDLIALGLVAQVLHTSVPVGAAGPLGPAVDTEALEAQVRLDERLGRPGPAPTARACQAWGQAAVELLGQFSATEQWQEGEALLRRADQLLAELGGQQCAYRSDSLPSGFEQRIARAAVALTDWYEARQTAPDPSASDPLLAGAVSSAIRRARSHQAYQQSSRRVERLAMAARLIRRGDLSLISGPASAPDDPGPTGLPSLARHYVRDGAWLDAARTSVSRGDHDRTFDALCQVLTAEADAARERDGAALARMAAAAAQPLPEHLVGVETVLDRVVGPLATGRASQRVLLVVLDGLSWPTFTELAEDLQARGWVPCQRATDPFEPVTVAALPTVTEVSRASLLTGTLRRGDSGSERRAFAEHSAVRAGAAGEEVLFHKADLRAGGLDSLPRDVLDAIANRQRKVVGIVLNNIDERLKDVAQPPDGWDLDHSLDPLGLLLAEARRAGRVVVLTGDHGHILDRDAEARAGGGDSGGERWRPPEPGAGDGETHVSGPRVVTEGHTAVLPWREQLRYSTARRNGYHGGLSPQELFVPLVVLASDRLDGWYETGITPPPWWEDVPLRRPQVSVASVTRTVPGGTLPSSPAAAGAPTLFDAVVPEPAAPTEPAAVAMPEAPVWVDELLVNEQFRQQRSRRRVRLDDFKLRRLLCVLDAAGGQPIADIRLADEAGLPRARVSGYVVQLQDLLNLDGYPVLQRSAGEVRFNPSLLATQFELAAPVADAQSLQDRSAGDLRP